MGKEKERNIKLNNKYIKKDRMLTFDVLYTLYEEKQSYLWRKLGSKDYQNNADIEIYKTKDETIIFKGTVHVVLIF